MLQTPGKPETETLLLELPTTIKLYVTPEQFTALAECNRELQLERTAKGELIVNPPTGWRTGKRNWSISGELYIWWRNADEPGEAFDSSTAFILPNGATRTPDACWIIDTPRPISAGILSSATHLTIIYPCGNT